MKLNCMNIRCRYCNDDYECTADKVELRFEGINTVLQGFREVASCKTFEESDLSKQMGAFVATYMREREL